LVDCKRLYALLTGVFAKYPDGHVDRQSQLVEKLQLIRALSGEKPSFFAMTHDPDRRAMYDDLAKEIGGQKCFFGATAVVLSRTAHLRSSHLYLV